ncbi:MAG TPA: ABC transporter permease [Bryobacteraceae bacterium]|nr:ABC transporter permease [Bryobacteraceae bacterium]
MLGDVTLALRNLGRQPGFTALAVCILALGIGGATAVFSVVNAVLLKSLPFPESERIVAVTTGARSALAGGDYLDIREGTPAFERMAYYYGGQVNVRTRNGAEFAGAAFASPDFFSVLGLQSFVAGRGFSKSDKSSMAVISADFASRNYGSAEAALGQQVVLYETAYTIAGIAPGAQPFPPKTSVWVMAPDVPENQSRTAHNYRGLARLRPGQTEETAQTQLSTISQRLAQQFPQTHSRKSFRVTQLHETLVANSRETLQALLGAVLILLLIACANVANLLLAKGAGRAREIAVRTALGSGAWPIIRMLLTESFALATLAAVAGLGLAWAGLRILVTLAPPNTPRINEVAIDGGVLAFTFLTILAATVTFGLIPAWQALHIDIQSALKQGGGRGIVAGGANRLRRGLVVAEIAMAFVLALSAGLIFKSFVKLNEVDLGFRPGGVLVAYAAVPASGAEESQRAAARWFTDLSGKLAELPGVEYASAAMGVPTGSYNSSGSFIIEGKQEWNSGRASDLPQARFRLAGANYFHTLGIGLRGGRDFSVRDAGDDPLVAIVSESLAKQYFPREDPIGRRVQAGLDKQEWMTIVGVVGDVRSASPDTAPAAELYMPYAQHPRYADELQVVVRTKSDPAMIMEPVRRLIHGQRPEVALRFVTLDQMVNDTIALPRFRTVLLGTFSAIAVLLALAGVYGVMAYIVEQRRTEFGVRLAMGATGADLAKQTLTDALRLAAIGVGAGLCLSLLAQKTIASFLFGVQPTDVTTWALAIACLSVVAILAAWMPARRAATLNPADILRGD